MSLDKEFVQAIFAELFNKNFNQYEAALNKPVNNDMDTYGKARRALSKLDESDRIDVTNFLKVVIADSAAVIFGTLDGVHFPDDLEGDFSLSCNGSEIQGDLLDIFIERVQADGAHD